MRPPPASYDLYGMIGMHFKKVSYATAASCASHHNILLYLAVLLTI